MIILLIAIVSIGCQNLKIKDKEVCGDLGKAGAHCAHTLTSEKRDLSKLEWDKTRFGWLCMDSTGFNETETALDQACQLMQCTYEQSEQVQTIKTNLKDVVKSVESKKVRK